MFCTERNITAYQERATGKEIAAMVDQVPLLKCRKAYNDKHYKLKLHPQGETLEFRISTLAEICLHRCRMKSHLSRVHMHNTY